MDIVIERGRVIGSVSWTTGFCPLLRKGHRKMSLVEEVRLTGPVAVIERLMQQDRWWEAEWIMDKFL